MIRAHIRAYRAIHRFRREMGYNDTMVGASHHLRILDPLSGSLPERGISSLFNRLFQEVFLEGMSSGRYVLPFGFGRADEAGDYQDFIGLNYYSRDMIAFRPGELSKIMRVREGAPVNDLGWEIYPEGLFRICTMLHKRFGKPIFITENGTCDFDDRFRGKYLLEHLSQVKRLIDSGVVLARYYHWSFMDNFELAEGLKYRFGLVHVDFKTLKRTIKKSGLLYRDIIARREVTKKMIREHEMEY